MEWQQGEFAISTEQSRLNVAVIHDFLTNSYWAKGIQREIVERSVQNSLCFGLYKEPEQIGFARVISDFATFAYIGDVFVLPAYRGLGLSTWLMHSILEHPRLQGLRRWVLVTADAHGLYRNIGFTKLKRPDAFMEIYASRVYEQPDATDS